MFFCLGRTVWKVTSGGRKQRVWSYFLLHIRTWAVFSQLQPQHFISGSVLVPFLFLTKGFHVNWLLIPFLPCLGTVLFFSFFCFLSLLFPMISLLFYGSSSLWSGICLLPLPPQVFPISTPIPVSTPPLIFESSCQIRSLPSDSIHLPSWFCPPFLQDKLLIYRELYSKFCGDLNGKEIQKRGNMCIYVADSLCCTAETNSIVNKYTPIKIKNKKNQPPSKKKKKSSLLHHKQTLCSECISNTTLPAY